MIYEEITMGNEEVERCKHSGSHFKILDPIKVIRSNLVRAHGY
jgi:hypothetical protein